MRLVIFGPQGAGKGTQSARITEKYGIPDIATGDIFRWAIKGGTALGLKVREYVESGRLVPDDLTIEVVKERLSAPDAAAGFLLDGFPRTIDQAKALDELLAEQGNAPGAEGDGPTAPGEKESQFDTRRSRAVSTALDAALAIEVPEEVSLRRLLGRRACSKCGRNYHVDSPPVEDWICDTCGGEVVERVDDLDEATVRRRLQLYHEQTEPLKAYYDERGLLRVIDGTASPDEVFEQIVTVL
jgi:adenylate kinase